MTVEMGKLAKKGYTGEAEPFVAVPNWVWQNPRLSASDVRVYIALKHFWNRRTGQCNPAHAAIASEAQVSIGQVRNHSLPRLVESGIIETVPNTKGGRRSHNYVLRNTPQTASQPLTSGPERASMVDTRASTIDYPGASMVDPNQEEPEQEHGREASLVDNSGGLHWCLDAEVFVAVPMRDCSECRDRARPR